MSRKLAADRCLCRACGEYFNSTSMFDRHRVGRYKPLERRCLSPAEMTAKGYSVNAGGFWISGKRPILTFTSSVVQAIATDPLPTQRVPA